MNVKQAYRFLAKEVGPHSFFITKEWVRHALQKDSATRYFEDAKSWRVSVFFPGDTHPHCSVYDQCQGCTAATLDEAVRGALKARDLALDERRRVRQALEVNLELQGDRIRAEIAQGERLPDGTPA